MDLEGIVCKRKDSPYKVTEKPSPHWIKIKNPKYPQADEPNTPRAYFDYAPTCRLT